MQEDAGRTVSSGTGQSWSATSLPPLRGKVGPRVRKRKARPETAGFRAEAIGFCLDRLEAGYRGANDAEVEPQMKP
jgi:hypothetical protein